MSRSYLWLKYLAALSAVAAIAIVIHAQQTGPGGVPGGGGSGGAVSSVFGRMGAVTAASGDYTVSQVTNAADVTANNTFTAIQTFSHPQEMADFFCSSTINCYASFQAAGSPMYWFGVNGSGNTPAGDFFLWDNTNGAAVFDLNYQAFKVNNSQTFQFMATDTSSGTPWSGLSSTGTGVVDVGSGAHGDNSGWLQSAAIGNGVGGNTDLRGHITLASGSGTYTFTKTYTVAPTCVATDTTTAAAVKVTTSITTLTLTGTGTDTLNYICAD